jgi:hypothetical protein
MLLKAAKTSRLAVLICIRHLRTDSLSLPLMSDKSQVTQWVISVFLAANDHKLGFIFIRNKQICTRVGKKIIGTSKF